MTLDLQSDYLQEGDNHWLRKEDWGRYGLGKDGEFSVGHTMFEMPIRPVVGCVKVSNPEERFRFDITIQGS